MLYPEGHHIHQLILPSFAQNAYIIIEIKSAEQETREERRQ